MGQIENSKLLFATEQAKQALEKKYPDAKVSPSEKPMEITKEDKYSKEALKKAQEEAMRIINEYKHPQDRAA